jgi:hypothetical protein
VPPTGRQPEAGCFDAKALFFVSVSGGVVCGCCRSSGSAISACPVRHTPETVAIVLLEIVPYPISLSRCGMD